MSKTNQANLIPLLLLGTIHILFLYYIVSPSLGWYSFTGLIPFLAYKILPIQIRKLNFVEIGIDILTFGLGLLFTIWITIKYDTSPVFSAALTGTISSFIPNTTFGIKPKFIQNLSHAKLAIYAGSFAGMTGFHHYISLPSILTIAITGGLIYNLLRSSFIGLGGKLGSIGFGAVILYLISTNFFLA
jgi:hypothetical protein